MRYSFAPGSSAKPRTLWPFLFGVFCCSFATAQPIAVYGGQQQYVSPKHVLTGTVVNSATGAAIPYALVQVEQNAKLADQNGNFRFDNLVSSTVNIQVHKPGFFGEQDLNQMRGAMMVSLSDHATNVTVPLIPEAIISGHVENPEGEPLQLPVRLRASQVINGRRIWQDQGQRQTDEDGNFRIADLKPGIYYVQVGPNAVPHPSGNSQTANEKFDVVPAEYYPGVRDLSAATPLRLIAGQHAALEFAMKRVPAYRVSGQVTGVVSGGPQNFGGLSFADRDGERMDLGIRFDPRTGRFQAFPVAIGSYRLRYNGRDAEGQQLYADVPINVTGDIPELRIPVGLTVSVPVEFETEFTRQDSGRAQGGSSYDVITSRSVTFGSSGRQQVFYGQLRLISRSEPNRQFFSSREKPDGPMLIRGVEPGTYDVETDPNGAAYVASVTCGGLDLLREPLVIAEGADPQPIQVVLRDDGASLSGAVQIPDGDRTAQVLMVAEGDAIGPPRQIYVDPYGKFQTQGVPPGNYEVMAFDRLDGVEYRNREVLREYLSHAAHVTLSPDQQAKVTVDLIRTRE